MDVTLQIADLTLLAALILVLKEFFTFNTTAKRKFLMLMPIGSFDMTCFMTVLRRCASIRSDNFHSGLWLCIILEQRNLKDRERETNLPFFFAKA